MASNVKEKDEEKGKNDDWNELSSSYQSSVSSLSNDDNRSKSKGYSISTIDENTSLLSTKRRRGTSTFNATLHAVTSSIALATSSINRFTTSTYLGFTGSAYAVAQYKQQVHLSKTLSLANVPSFDRYTPTVVAFFTFMTMITGLSVFAIPILVARCGLVIVGCTALCGVLTWYSCLLINKCQYQVSKNGQSKRVYENYIELGEVALPWKGITIMKIMVGSSVCTDIYSLIFCAQVSTDLLSKQINLDPRIWMLIWVGLVFPLFFIRKMSVLAWLSFFALIVYAIGLLLTLGVLVSTYSSWTFENINPTFQLKYFFVGYGIIINSFNGHIAMPALEASMKQPEKYNVTIAAAFTVNTLLKICLSVFGAAAFGLLTQGSILANLSTFGYEAMAINILVAVFMFSQYPSSIFVVFEMLDMHILPHFLLFEDKKKEWLWMVLSRSLVSVFIAFVAVSIPNFEMVTSFVGNIRGTLATVVLPVYFYLKIKRRSISTISKVFHWLLIVIVTLLGCAGAGFSLYEIIQKS